MTLIFLLLLFAFANAQITFMRPNLTTTTGQFVNLSEFRYMFVDTYQNTFAHMKHHRHLFNGL